MTDYSQKKITVYSGAPDTVSAYFAKIYRYRSLIWVFAMRDLRVKYSQTIIGVGWSLIQPLIALIIFTFFFEYVLEVNSSELPYSVYVLSGLMGWNFFTYLFSSGSQSIQESSSLIKKIYFPKSILPLSKVVVAGVEMIISSLILIPLMLFHKISLSIHVLAMPLVWVFNAMCALMLVFWLGAFAIRKRDLYHLIPFLVQFGIWITPVFFSPNLIPYNISFLMDYNPMANVLDLWRWSLFGTGQLKLIYLVNFIILLSLLASGMYVFSRKENNLSDYQ